MTIKVRKVLNFKLDLKSNDNVKRGHNIKVIKTNVIAQSVVGCYLNNNNYYRYSLVLWKKLFYLG